MDIDEQVALVTGGANGLGEATARFLSDEGADVAILDIDGIRAAQVAAEVLGYSQQCDVSDAEHCAVGVSSAMARFGQAPRIVVNCAGVNMAARIVNQHGKTSIPLFRKVMEVNVYGTYQIMSYAAQAMMDLPPLDTGERGVIINVSAIAHQDGQIDQGACAAASGAIAALTLPAAREFASFGVRVVTIAPGLFDTAMTSRRSNAAGAATDADASAVTVPHPERLGTPPEFSALVGEIIRNPYLNGSVIRLDGALRNAPE